MDTPLNTSLHKTEPQETKLEKAPQKPIHAPFFHARLKKGRVLSLPFLVFHLESPFMFAFVPSMSRRSLAHRLFALALSLAFCVSFSAFAVAAPVFAKEDASPKPGPKENHSPSAEAVKGGTLPIEDIRLFVQIMELVRQYSVEETTDKALIQKAIQGMLTGLDPHSSFLEAAGYENLKIQSKGDFGGLGITVSSKDNLVIVVAPIDDTPAERAGIQSGDVIYKVNGHSVQGLKLDEVVEQMRGKPGTKVQISVVRYGVHKPLEFTLTRAVIKLKTASAKVMDKDYLYIRLSSFSGKTAEEMMEAVKKLPKKPTKYKGIVLDLRNNPGGILQSAVKVVDAFVDKGTIVTVKGRAKSEKEAFNATKKTFFGTKTPLVVLINHGSASAAEIVAGGVQDLKRGVLLGLRSFGKGSVQTIIPVTKTQAVRLTTALYYTPLGRSIQAEGIVPDINVAPAKITFESQDTFGYSEADLQGHLSNPLDSEKKKVSEESLLNSAKNTAKNLKNGDSEEGDDKESDVKDYQLNQALSLLKGVAILKTNH